MNPRGGLEMKMLLKFLSILSLIIIVASTAYGDETATDKEKKEQSVKHLTVEEIVVTEKAVTEPAATVVGEKTIEKGRNINIPDVLKNEPDIDINRRALVGDNSDTLKIRGLSGNRIMLNIDGRAINAAGVQGGYFIDWSTIPLDNIERIEIMKGGSSVKYGNNAGGGVINVITKKPTEKPTYSFYGSYGAGKDISYSQNYRITHTYKIGPLGYSIGGSYQKADEFLWNNDYEAKNYSAKLYVDMPLMAEMTLGGQYTEVDRGFAIQNRLSTDPDNPNFFVKRNSDYPLSLGESFSPGTDILTTPGPGAHWEKTKYLLDFGYKQPVKNALIEFKAYQNHEDRDEKNYSASWLPKNPYPDGKLVLDRTVKPDRSHGGSLELDMPLKDHEILGGIEKKVISTDGQDIHYFDPNYYTKKKQTMSSSSGASNYMWGYYLQDNWGITDEFLLTPGVRYDTYNGADGAITDEGLSPSLTGTYGLTKNDTLTASIYRKYITPSAPDAGWWNEERDPALKMEKNDAVELTFKHDFSQKAFTRVSSYHYMIDDYIKRYTDPNGVRGCYNIDSVQLTGVSIDGATEIMSRITLRGNVTYQKSKKEGDIMDKSELSNKLDLMPEWKGNAGFDLKLPYKEAVFSTGIRYVGEQKTVSSNKLIELDPYTTADIELRVPVTKQSEISVYAENLFDAHYEERFGYPMPGRIIGAAVKAGF
jgi:outer membrane receptor protein involved in Fe transport